MMESAFLSNTTPSIIWLAVKENENSFSIMYPGPIPFWFVCRNKNKFMWKTHFSDIFGLDGHEITILNNYNGMSGTSFSTLNKDIIKKFLNNRCLVIDILDMISINRDLVHVWTILMMKCRQIHLLKRDRKQTSVLKKHLFCSLSGFICVNIWKYVFFVFEQLSLYEKFFLGIYRCSRFFFEKLE